MRIFIGAPVRNRAWVLRRYLDALIDQNVEKEFCFVLNDSIDESESILQSYGMPYVEMNLGSTYEAVRGKYSIAHLAQLRNRLLEEFLRSDCEYFFSVDTDVIIPENSLVQLVEDDKDIISMLIRNHPTLQAHNAMVAGRHMQTIPEGIIPVDVTGAVYLIKRKVIEAGVRYQYYPQGEDIPFCKLAAAKGFGIYCDTRLKPIHVYKEGVELIAKTDYYLSACD